MRCRNPNFLYLDDRVPPLASLPDVWCRRVPSVTGLLPSLPILSLGVPSCSSYHHGVLASCPDQAFLRFGRFSFSICLFTALLCTGAPCLLDRADSGLEQSLQSLPKRGLPRRAYGVFPHSWGQGARPGQKPRTPARPGGSAQTTGLQILLGGVSVSRALRAEGCYTLDYEPRFLKRTWKVLISILVP